MISPRQNLWIRYTTSWLGLDSHRTSHREKWLSAAGAFIGILAVVYLSRLLVGDFPTPLIVASMGAAAVLVFAVPYGALPQPWPLLAGNTVSALIGVACAHWVAPLPISAAAAVGLSVLAMYYLRCLHPPGGASALFAVIGGSAVTGLNMEYAFVPVFINALFLMLAALLYNNLFPTRRDAMQPRPDPADIPPGCETASRQDIRIALQQVDSFIDITEEELHDIIRLVLLHSRHRREQESAAQNGASRTVVVDAEQPLT